MATKLGVYQGALFRIRQRKIASLTEETPSRYAIDDVYDKVIAYMLEQGLWNFAQRTVELSPTPELKPAFGFQNGFLVPDDFVRLISISSNTKMWPTLLAQQYRIEDGVWQADCNPLYVSYVSNDSQYGGKLSLWPQTFADAIEFEIAKRIAPVLTNISAADMDELKADAKRTLRNARSKDCFDQAGQEQPPGKLTMSRRNWRTHTLWYR